MGGGRWEAGDGGFALQEPGPEEQSEDSGSQQAQDSIAETYGEQERRPRIRKRTEGGERKARGEGELGGGRRRRGH